MPMHQSRQSSDDTDAEVAGELPEGDGGGDGKSTPEGDGGGDGKSTA